ncbi:pyridoxal phosphate-dependent aminotransferase [Paraliomyxa miuraensis]|uniref:pyridoxal phosphate-dependent aminotransferase n=1 Tax=Paraliomyxa miuraensis TaxID=376150 RepID=UPI00224FB11D|nr:aminotransferase class I/II-fold pyridoxal phosphate-dependent enzyme [Paraliomyxa miuraensis]MCX4241486.1 aminotransferase class I/II-fold pyridoxal phosphate-dependent enzyme [Paraliomyxa miuraensis]
MARTTPQINLNLNVRGMQASATVAINERSNSLIAQGREVLKLGLGQSPFPVPEPVVEALRRNAHEKDYLPVKGLAALRDAVADYHSRSNGLVRTGEDVLIGPGSKELMFLLQLVFYGDLVIPTPAWVSYAPQARIIGRQVRLVSTRQEDDWRLSPEQLAALCEEDPGRPRILILNYPSNPTGATFRVDELRALARVAAQHRVVMLSDEIYGEVHHKGQHVSIARFYPEGTIISAGLSKWCGAGGWRLGTFLFPPTMRWLLDAMAAAASETFTSTSAPIQHAAVTAFRGGEEIEEYLQRSRRVLGALGRWCHRRLTEGGLRCCKPSGGFYLFPDFSTRASALAARGIDDSVGLCERLLEDTGVAILPGSCFGRDVRELTARLAYVDFDGEAALHAVAALGKDAPLDDAFLRRHCAKVTKAIDRMVEWASD